MRLEKIIAEALKNVDNNRYVLAKVVGMRANELSKAQKPLIKVDKGTKFADIAIMEIAQGKLKVESYI